MLLFVYGTLKTGERNNPLYLAGQSVLGPARTPPRYRLYDCGPYPGLVEADDGVSVVGELWDIDESCLARIDLLEGVAEGLYERRVIRLEEPAVEASVYLYLRGVEGLPDCGPAWPRHEAQG
jgi:gamma-glutamylcyclotransferase (GGCT)/AIG2-like uncharacterized protein YtfP